MTEFETKSPYRVQAEWVRSMCSKPEGLHTGVYNLTPELASYLLENNPENRNIRQSVVDAYIRDMLTDRWHLNGEPIIISKEGQLNDGQHRCWAVATSGKDVRMVFVFGVERETRITLNQGITRRLSDYLGMEGVENATRIATLAGMVWRYLRNNSVVAASGTKGQAEKKSAKSSKQELMALIEQDPSIAQAVKSAPMESKLMRTIAAGSIFHFCMWLICRNNQEREVHDFLERIVSGTGLHTGSAEIYIRNRLMTNRGKLKPNESVEIIIRGWNAYCGGNENVKHLPVTGGKLPAPMHKK